ncbi:kinase-like domain-containing protein [Mycena floridula]|nr:kinase-like domain-containing protein [Mycena floridula]
MRERLKLAPATISPLSTASLFQHEHGGGNPGDPKITVAWQVRLSSHPKVIDARFASSITKWSSSIYMKDIKADIVDTLCVQWTRMYGLPLLPDEVEYRFSPNRGLKPNTLGFTLGEFWTFYSQPSTVDLISNIPTVFKPIGGTKGRPRKDPIICFDMYVEFETVSSLQHYMSNIHRVSLFSGLNEQRTTRTSNSLRLNVLPAPPLSLFKPSSRATFATIQNLSPISLRRILCRANSLTGQCTFVGTNTVVHGDIMEKPFSKGTMKEAYDLTTTDGQQLVAKKFFRLSASETNLDSFDEAESVSIVANRKEIEGEAIRLSQGRWFLDTFFGFCKTQPEVSVDSMIIFAEAFLGVTIIKHFDDDQITESDGITYLIEKKRPTTVSKFSGTLTHQAQRHNLQSHTVSAFAHFAFVHSQRSLVFADLQGKLILLISTLAHVNGKDVMVLFDVMTHTTSGDSGVGDFGEEGIASFVRDHSCLQVCLKLGLDTSMPMVLA